jgi:hypothetical protein
MMLWVRRTICSALAVVVLSAIQGGSATALPNDPLALEASFEYRDAPNAAALLLYSYNLQYTVDPRRITFSLETRGGRPVRGGGIVVEGVTMERADPQPHVYAGSAAPGSRFVNFHLDARGFRESTWIYDAPPPVRSQVDFRGDRVVGYDPPRMLP